MADAEPELRRWCRIVQLAARRVCGRDAGDRDDRGGDREVGMCDAIRWRWCHSAATTWGIISGIGWPWAAHPASAEDFSRELVPQGPDGRFLWPGYGENVRVLKWILERVEGRGAAQETPIGYVPARGALTLDGMNISASTVDDLMRVDAEDWEQELIDIKEFFQKFGDRLPRELNVERENLSQRLAPSEVAR